MAKDGQVFYGKTPPGITCVREEKIGGTLTVAPSENPRNSVQTNFKCDGRTYCSQMTSCEEATFFLRNCPNVKMDGNNDGVPCERQWCK
ncbi:MAG: excalibur calcium-binding domain-containing protein [Candidatus Competibacteraceae bacterium]|nr:MAG: excalibur calcium-binding domain-containing protein [Candidatus Competibacteraceae bacterium]